MSNFHHSALGGKFCLMFAIDSNDLSGQGRVLDLVEPGVYLIQLYSALDGHETDQMLYSLEDMYAERWYFYDAETDWRAAAEKIFAREMRATAPSYDLPPRSLRKG